MSEINLVALVARQHVGDLYVSVMQSADLFAVAKSDRLRLEDLKFPKYAGYQRALAADRVAAIRDYLQTPRSTFPNAIIVSIDSDFITNWTDSAENPGVTRITIRREPGAISIIDGQHRAAALDAIEGDFHVIVTFFVDLEMIRKAEIFAKINSTQRAVNPSIAFQLFGYSEDRSPQRTAHEVAEVLNSSEGSPFFKQLRMLGKKDAWALGRLSQSTFCKELMTLYTRNASEDEHRLLRGDKPDDYAGYPMRSWFIEGQDKRILQTVWRFFVRVANTWPEQWAAGDGTSVLLKTTGYGAFMDVLKAWLVGPRASEVLQDAGVAEALGAIQAKYEEAPNRFVRDNYPAGNQGRITLRRALLEDLNLDH